MSVVASANWNVVVGIAISKLDHRVLASGSKNDAMISLFASSFPRLFDYHDTVDSV